MALGSSGPVENKVIASTVGSAASLVIVWVLNTYVLPTDMPDVVQGAIELLVVAGLTFASGFLSKHTVRTDEDALGSSSGRHSAAE